MGKITLTLIILFNFFSMYGQELPIRYSEIEWQAMMEYIEKECADYDTFIQRKYKRRKIKKDLKILRLINEMIAVGKEPLMNDIVAKHKVKFYGASVNPDYPLTQKKRYAIYDFRGGYLMWSVIFYIKENGVTSKVEVSIGNEKYEVFCQEIQNKGEPLNFHYVYNYIRPHADFRIGFDSFTGFFMSEILSEDCSKDIKM